MFQAFSRPSSRAQCLQWRPLVLPSYRGDCAVFVVGPAGPTTNTARLPPRYEGKTRGCHCSHWAPDDGGKTPETCWAVNKRQDNKLKNCCIWLVIYLNANLYYPCNRQEGTILKSFSSPTVLARQLQEVVYVSRNCNTANTENSNLTVATKLNLGTTRIRILQGKCARQGRRQKKSIQEIKDLK